MRPHKLIMTAFGPFANKTEVDFDAMGNTVYLISGETGAGKTTIFDGIVYALYGTASGSQRSILGSEAMHSDFAKNGNHRDAMEVELRFSHAGHTYTVTRSVSWGTTGTSKTATKEAVLKEEGTDIVIHARGAEAKGKVTEKIQEILGLDAEQFRRIIMLAQGEFQEFLRSGSQKRGEILGKLYDNRRHQDLQLRLKAANALLNEQIRSATERKQTQLDLFRMPLDLSEEEQAFLSVDHPSLLSVTETILNRMETRQAELAGEITEQAKRQEAFLNAINSGLEANKQLTMLADMQKELAEIQLSSSIMEELRGRLERAIQAEKVLPAEAALCQAKENYQNLLNTITDLQTKREQLKKRSEELDAVRKKTDERNAPIVAELQGQHSALGSVLHLYTELENALAVLSDCEEELKKANNAVQTAKENQNAIKKRRKELEEALKALEGAGESAVSLALRAKQDAEQRLDALKVISDGLPTIETLILTESVKAAALKHARLAEQDAINTHSLLNSAFLAGQAGILAEELRQKLKTEAQVPCPVCGAIHTAADESSFASLHDEIPSREQVEEAFRNLTALHQDTVTAEGEYREASNTLQAQKNSLLEKSAELIGISDWDTLAEGSALSTALNSALTDVESAKARYSKSKEDKAAKENALLEKADTDSAAEKAEREQEKALHWQSDAGTKLAAAQTTVKNWKSQLAGFPESKAEAETKLDELSRQIAILQKEIEDAINACQACENEQSSNQGALSSAEDTKQDRALEVEEAENKFRQRLTDCGFSDEEDYHAAMSPDGIILSEEALAAWIQSKSDEVSSFDNRIRHLNSSITQQQRITEGLNPVNIEELQEQLDTCKDTLDKLRDKDKLLSGDISVNRGVLDSLKDLQAQTQRYNLVAARLNPIADVSGGNLPFSRHVLIDFFQRIVEQANVHLYTMTDGEFCLVPTEETDGRKSAGLELKILNNITNYERDTGSLSGGQLFEASLALALGLSSVVQMESSSTVQIDSLFIDEGFGSLDSSRLNKALDVLNHLSDGKIQIGLISHVSQLECLPRKIIVRSSDHGSYIQTDTDL